MGKFGWSYPPGVTDRMIDEAYGIGGPCAVCGGDEETCICPECPVCRTYGDPTCYKLFPKAAFYSGKGNHGMVRTEEQRFQLECEEREWAEEARLENLYWENYMKEMEEEEIKRESNS